MSREMWVESANGKMTCSGCGCEQGSSHNAYCRRVMSESLQLILDKQVAERTPLDWAILFMMDLQVQEPDLMNEAAEQFGKLNSDYLEAIKANVEVGKLNADLQEQVGELRDALQWAWDNMKFTSYPSDGWEYEFCDGCGAPEWRHKKNCKAEEQKKIALRLLKKEPPKLST